MAKIPKEVLLKYRYPDPILKEKYKILNYILTGLVGVFVILRIFLYKTILVELVISGFSGSALKTAGGVIFLINTLMLVLMIWIIKLLLSFDARAYLFLVFLSIWTMANLLRMDIISLILVIITLILSLLLKKKLFPNIPLFSYVPKQQT